MKRLAALVLVLALLLCGAFFCWALAEEGGTVTPSAPVVDLTGLVIAVLLAVFEFLMARFAHKVIPPAKAWLEAHTTEKERGLLWDAVCEFVDAAEQIIKGPAMGEQRMAYVQAGLRQRGLTIDVDMIEAAVKRMKDRTFATLAEGLEIREGNVETTKTTETEVEIDDYPHLPPLEEWPMEMIVAFTQDNGIPHEGCETKEEYLEAIIKAAGTETAAAGAETAAAGTSSVSASAATEGLTGPASLETAHSAVSRALAVPKGEGKEPASAVKDYCELDEDGNPIPEEPQSGNE